MQSFIKNSIGRHVRVDKYQGREYRVVPVVMLTEDVHNGSNGPLFYSGHEIAKATAAWDFKPITIGHPTENGVGVSANDPAILQKQQVGFIRNTRWDGKKLRAEAWLDFDRLNALAPGVITALNSDQLVEVSTGLFTENEAVAGHYDGVNFNYAATKHQPDHLAILPNQIGACSIAKGCGLLQHNKESNIMNPEMALPLPTMNFDPQCGCGDPVANHGGGDRDDSLPMPVWNFDAPCHCKKATVNQRGHGPADGNFLPLPVMTFD